MQALSPVGKAKNAPGEITLPPIDKFPEQLHRDVKSGAAQKGISMKEFFVQSLRYALKNDHVIQGKAVINSNNENGQGTIRRSSPPDAGEAAQENRKDKGKRKRN